MILYHYYHCQFISNIQYAIQFNYYNLKKIINKFKILGLRVYTVMIHLDCQVE